MIGLVPIVLVLMVRYWVPESPRWLIRMGRHDDARKSLAWALMVDPSEISLPTVLPEAETARWRELFKYPRSVIAGCLTGLTQTGGVGAALWGATLFVLVLKVSPAEASYLMIFVTISAIVGRFFVTALIEPMGRRGSGILCGIGAAVFMIMAGYLHDVFIGTISLFFVVLVHSRGARLLADRGRNQGPQLRGDRRHDDRFGCGRRGAAGGASVGDIVGFLIRRAGSPRRRYVNRTRFGRHFRPHDRRASCWSVWSSRKS